MERSTSLVPLSDAEQLQRLIAQAASQERERERLQLLVDRARVRDASVEVEEKKIEVRKPTKIEKRVVRLRDQLTRTAEHLSRFQAAREVEKASLNLLHRLRRKTSDRHLAKVLQEFEKTLQTVRSISLP